AFAIIEALQLQPPDNGEQHMIPTLRNVALAGCVLLAMLTASVSAAEPLKLDDDTARINYSLGYQIGGDFKRQGVEMNAAAVVTGIEDALAGAEPLMPRDEMHKTLSELKRKVTAEQRATRRNLELQYLSEGKQFMEENAAKPGVTTSKSGLQYKIIEAGSGKTPQATDQVTVNYRGTLTNGNEFDSSYQRGEPTAFRLDSVIKGWTEGLQLVKEGGKLQLVIPPELAYGDRGPLGHRTLVFDVELISVGASKPAETTSGAQAGDKL
ncbi:MAG: FKBP-type peptidyl-prolyl cis-trans isomerase, partial [Gammaproteobacteria bacterium]